MCPDWESNQKPFGLQAGAESTEPHQPRQAPPFERNNQFVDILNHHGMFNIGIFIEEKLENMDQKNRKKSLPNG